MSVSIASAAIMSSAWEASHRTLVNSLTAGTLVPMERGERREEKR